MFLSVDNENENKQYNSKHRNEDTQEIQNQI